MKNSAILLLATILFSNAINAQLKPVKYSDGSQALNGLFAKATKKSSQNPGILLLPAWLGIDKASKDIAENLSKLGYNVFIADIYGEGNYPKTLPKQENKLVTTKRTTKFIKNVSMQLCRN